MLTVWQDFAEMLPIKQLSSLAYDFVERHIPIPNHQVIPWEGGVFENLEFSAVYCTSARHMPEEFEIIECDPVLVFVWLVPINPEEQEFIREAGWSAFEELINEQQSDFFNLNRARIKLKL